MDYFGPFGVINMSSCLGYCGGYSGVIVGLFCDYSGVVAGLLWGYSGLWWVILRLICYSNRF